MDENDSRKSAHHFQTHKASVRRGAARRSGVCRDHPVSEQAALKLARHPGWMEAVQDMETAKLRMLELARRSPGEYFVFSQETQEIVSNTAPLLYELVF